MRVKERILTVVAQSLYTSAPAQLYTQFVYVCVLAVNIRILTIRFSHSTKCMFCWKFSNNFISLFLYSIFFFCWCCCFTPNIGAYSIHTCATHTVRSVFWWLLSKFSKSFQLVFGASLIKTTHNYLHTIIWSIGLDIKIQKIPQLPKRLPFVFIIKASSDQLKWIQTTLTFKSK